MIKVAINGYGRIGRIAHRVIIERFSTQIEVVAINASSSTDIKGWMNLLKFDSAYGPLLNLEVSCEPAKSGGSKDLIGYLEVDGNKIPVLSQKDPAALPWKEFKVDLVIESTGSFLTEEKLKVHLEAGAKGVILSAPAKEGNVPTFVLGVNAKEYKGEKIINNASCTTNCIAPVAKVMVDNFGVEKALMTTVHAYTSDQRLQDGGHKDYRRSRAAAFNIVPTTTGATIAASQAVPELKNKFDGLSIRVPVICGSLADITFLLAKSTTVEEVNSVFKNEAANPEYEGILSVSEDPLVSGDIIANPASAVVDLSLTQVVGGNLVKVVAWYDNEYAYANRLIEEVMMVSKKLL